MVHVIPFIHKGRYLTSISSHWCFHTSEIFVKMYNWSCFQLAPIEYRWHHITGGLSKGTTVHANLCQWPPVLQTTCFIRSLFQPRCCAENAMIYSSCYPCLEKYIKPDPVKFQSIGHISWDPWILHLTYILPSYSLFTVKKTWLSIDFQWRAMFP